jgi:RNA polymerase sigma-70 factor (ECF subfamily)
MTEVTVADAGLDDDVVRAAARGEPDALRSVYVALAPAVFGYLRAKGVADPESVTSDVFVALLPQLERVSGGAAGLRKLTFAIAHARMVDEHRSRARTPDPVPYEPIVDNRTVASAEDDATASLADARVVAVLAVLPDDQQEVLRLRVVADLSIEQTAEIMGRSTGAIKQLQRRALLALREALAERRVTL